MTNKEKYRQAFSVLQTSGDFSMEAEQMAMRQKHHKMKTIAAAAAACIILAGGVGTAYAADLGGIQRTIQLWINGDSTEMQGGGVAMDGDGAERPLTEDEIMEQINQPDVEYEDDGSVWLYYKDQKLDITDRFKDGICYVKLTDGEETLYLTVKYENGYAVSKSKYISPQEFN